ncbi:glycosyltransferase [Fodinibius salsisoli]|uniref:Glycosyltransferase n=1 Tax=Fodinibius salsisoli TaxID=2820877 RepID=A0ABT3PTE4_9BACT|nr:glycosyltransferase [Fodinibius salsisoli]MCW9709128.1 glycosyltransferase [Fodinibius salsisoli]
MKSLLIIPFHDYKVALNNGFRTRDSHIYEHYISEEYDNIDNIIIINRPTSLAEVLLRNKKVVSEKDKLIKKSNHTYIQKINHQTYVVDFFVYDFFNVIWKRHAWLPQIYSSSEIVDRIKDVLSYLEITQYSIYMSFPFSVNLGLNLDANIKMLDAVDNFTEYKEWAYFRDKIEQLYDTAKCDFDHIIVNSKDTYRYLSKDCEANLELVPNGVDFKKFSGTFERPSDLPEDKPLVGYAGKMQRMFDTKLLSKLAVQNPDLNFVILGKFLDKKWKKKNWDKDIKGLSNVFYLGDKHYERIPSYYNHFDILFIPYIIENQHGGDPIKFYEYMAANKPIISTNIGNIEKFHDDKNIIICDSRDDFLNNFQIVKNQIGKNISYELPNELSWKSKSNYFAKLLFNEKKTV